MVRSPSTTDLRLPIKVFDFFSGCGGTSRGFRNAGMDVVFALDNDPDAARTFKQNLPGIHFVCDDIQNVSCEALQPLIDECKGHPILFSGCAPCQPFTKQKTTRHSDDDRRGLLNEFRRFVEWFRVEFVFVENVPGLQNVGDEAAPLSDFVDTLDKLGYKCKREIIASQSYGVPQIRRRLALVASRLGPIVIPQKTHGPGTASPEFTRVEDWIRNLPHIAAGETDSSDPNHRAAGLSPLNLERIRATPPGGDRLSWPDPLRLKCHSNGYTGHTDVYGRMRWKQPASGLTTRCISLSNGRFGHPEQDRAISVREAACLQTFPRDYVFLGSLNSTARQVGNAVPVLVAECFGRSFNDHVSQYIGRNQ